MRPSITAQKGSTVLHYAAAGGHAKVVQTLVDVGADATAVDQVSD